MSWHYLQGQEGVSSEAICWDGEQFAPSKSTTTLEEYCLPDNATGCFQDSPYGTTSEPSMADHGEEESMFYQAVSPARTSHGHGPEKGLKGSGQDYGLKCTESSAKCSRGEYGSKTSGTSGLEDLPLFGGCSQTSDTSAMTGTSTQATPEAHTYASAHSFSRTGPGRQWSSRMSASSVKCVESQSVRIAESIILSAIAQDHIQTTDGAWKTKIGELLPTPTCQDAKNNAGPSQFRRNTWPLNVIAGGPLNPEWVEWLMGWPIGWTDLEPLETDKFLEWSALHGKPCPPESQCNSDRRE